MSGRVEAGSPQQKNARNPRHHDATGPLRSLRTVSLTATNIATQYAGGAAINASSGFTPISLPGASRLPQVVVSGSGVETVYTLTGTSLDGDALTDTVTALAGGGTFKFSQPFATVTAFSSNVDPVGTTDLQWGDTWVSPPATALIVGTSGDVALRLADDATDVTLSDVQAGINPMQVEIIRITSTNATDLALGWS